MPICHGNARMNSSSVVGSRHVVTTRHQFKTNAMAATTNTAPGHGQLPACTLCRDPSMSMHEASLTSQSLFTLSLAAASPYCRLATVPPRSRVSLPATSHGVQERGRERELLCRRAGAAAAAFAAGRKGHPTQALDSRHVERRAPSAGA